MKYIIYFIIIWSHLENYILNDLDLLPSFFSLLDDIILLSIYGLVQLKFLRKKNDEITISILMFCVVGLISAILNSTLLTSNTILGIKNFVYPVLVISILSVQSKKYILDYLRFIIYIMLFEAVLVIIQYATYTNDIFYNRYDSGFGTFSFGSANILGIYFVLILVIINYLYNNKHLKRSNFLIYNSILGISILLTFSKIAWLLLIILLVIYIYKLDYSFKFNILDGVIKLLSSTLILIIIGVFVYISIYSIDDTNITNDFQLLTTKAGVEKIIENQISEEGSGRLFLATITILDLINDPIRLIFGWGPGNYSSYAGFALNGYKLEQVLTIFGDERGTRYDMEIVALVGEFGIIGLIFFINILFNIRHYIIHHKFYYITIFIFLFCFLTNNIFQTQWISLTGFIFISILMYSKSK